MRATLVLDDELLAEALSLTGLEGKSAVMREALKALIERETVRSLRGEPESPSAHWMREAGLEPAGPNGRTALAPKEIGVVPNGHDRPAAEDVLRDGFSGLTIWAVAPGRFIEAIQPNPFVLRETTGRTTGCPLGKHCAARCDLT